MTTWNQPGTSGGERWDTLSLKPQCDKIAVSEPTTTSTYPSTHSPSSQKERSHENSEVLSVSNIDENGLDLDNNQPKVISVPVNPPCVA